MAHISLRTPRLLALSAGLAIATPALAQTSQDAPSAAAANAATAAAAQVQATPPQNNGPTLWLFGVPIRPSAPVPPPYQGTSYEDLGGQPMNSVDQVMSQQFTDQQFTGQEK
jgi:hypothetical protein